MRRKRIFRVGLRGMRSEEHGTAAVTGKVTAAPVSF
jgi:hypothetical protein